MRREKKKRIPYPCKEFLREKESTKGTNNTIAMAGLITKQRTATAV